MSIYTEMRDAKIPLDHHESDLYVIVCEQSRRIAQANGYKSPSTFTSQVDGCLWYEFPFMYEPFWDAVLSRVNVQVIPQS